MSKSELQDRRASLIDARELQFDNVTNKCSINETELHVLMQDYADWYFNSKLDEIIQQVENRFELE